MCKNEKNILYQFVANQSCTICKRQSSDHSKDQNVSSDIWSNDIPNLKLYKNICMKEIKGEHYITGHMKRKGFVLGQKWLSKGTTFNH